MQIHKYHFVMFRPVTLASRWHTSIYAGTAGSFISLCYFNFRMCRWSESMTMSDLRTRVNSFQFLWNPHEFRTMSMPTSTSLSMHTMQVNGKIFVCSFDTHLHVRATDSNMRTRFRWTVWVFRWPVSTFNTILHTHNQSDPSTNTFCAQIPSMHERDVVSFECVCVCVSYWRRVTSFFRTVKGYNLFVGGALFIFNLSFCLE